MPKIDDINEKAKIENERRNTPLVASPSVFSDLDFMFNRWVNSHFPGGFRQPLRFESPMWQDISGNRTPLVDIIDKDEVIVIRAELPGVDRDNLDVTISDTVLTIKGTCKTDEITEKGNYFRSEISRGSFLRKIVLPDNVDTDKINAKLNDGLLEITLSKNHKSNRRSIKIE